MCVFYPPSPREQFSIGVFRPGGGIESGGGGWKMDLMVFAQVDRNTKRWQLWEMNKDLSEKFSYLVLFHCYRLAGYFQECERWDWTWTRLKFNTCVFVFKFHISAISVCLGLSRDLIHQRCRGVDCGKVETVSWCTRHLLIRGSSGEL